jgi:putative ABC transport system permease protein
LGVVVAMIVLRISSLSVGAEAVTIAFTPSFNLAATGLIVALLTGILAGVFPAFQAARAEIVEGLRQV